MTVWMHILIDYPSTCPYIVSSIRIQVLWRTTIY